MATYRTYKNGIYGKKYKKYYIVPSIGSDNKYWNIVDEKQSILLDHLSTLYDAIWECDKLCATEDEMRAIHLLYQQNIPALTDLISSMETENHVNGLSANEQMMLDFARKIRDRKTEGKRL